MKVKDAINVIEEKFPLDLQLDFDNSGLKCGNICSNLTGVLVTLDTNIETIKEAVSKNCNLIVEHHPTIFKPLYDLDFNSPKTNILFNCIKNNICLYSAHTNVDVGKDGLNDYFLEQILCQNKEHINNESVKNYRVGLLKNKMTLLEYVNKLETVFNEKLLFVGDPNKIIKTVACSNGAGGNDDNVFLTSSVADVFVSSEFKHSALMLAKNLNYAIIQISHFASEIGFLDLIFKLFTKKIKSDMVSKSTSNINPMRGL